MRLLPSPSNILNDEFLRLAINKAAVKNGYIPRNTIIKWIVACGPYFVLQDFGPYDGDELVTRGHKSNPSGDAVTADGL